MHDTVYHVYYGKVIIVNNSARSGGGVFFFTFCNVFL